MNKTLISTTIIALAVGTGGTLAFKSLTTQDVPVVEKVQTTETVKVIHQEDGKINIVNKDGLGVLIDEENLQEWLDSDIKDDKWIEELHAVAKQAADSDPLLKNTTEIQANYEQNITTQPQ